MTGLRRCLREPIPELADAARFLDAATSAHRLGNSALVESLITLANMPVIRQWTESIWGANSPYVVVRRAESETQSQPVRSMARMPSLVQRRELLARDGYHCRFCGIPLVRAEIRQRIALAYPHLGIWGAKNEQQHAAFQAMWVHYDHLVPHSLGGSNELENLVVTCAPCNCGRMNFTLTEVGLSDPRARAPVRTAWDGLERFGVI